MRFLLLLLLLTSSANQAQEDPEKRAADLVKQAEALAAKGSFEQARAIYLLIVKKYATTKVSTVAAYRAGDNSLVGWDLMHEGGNWRNRCNVHFMGDSYLYTDQDQRSFGGLAKANMHAMFEEIAFKEYKQYFNYWRLYLASKESGTTTANKKFDTALGGRAEGGTYGIDPIKAQSISDHMPIKDGVWIMIIRHGGGTPMAGVLYAGEAGVLVHEFGHTFGGLGDEYTSEVHGGMGNRGVNRQYNLSDVGDPDKVPWAHWFKNGEYARATGIGVHEGGNAATKGQWRPTPGNCCMAGGGPFCAVCREQIVIMIYNRVNPIDDSSPFLEPVAIKLKKSGETFTIADPRQVPWVLPMQPTAHKLTVKWSLKKTSDEPGSATATGPSQPSQQDPTYQDPAADPQAVPDRQFSKPPFEGEVMGSLLRAGDAKGRPIESPDFTKVKWSPGRWLLTVDVRDEMSYDLADPLTKKKVRVPWVVKDESNRLIERRAWDLVVKE